MVALGCAGRLAAKSPKPILPAVFPLKPNWTVRLDAPFGGPLATDGTRVFVVTREGLARAFDLVQGQPLWKRQLPPGTVLSAAPELLVARQPDGTVSRLGTGDGLEVWSRSSGIPGALPAVIDEDRLLVAGDGIAAMAVQDGRLLWGAPGAPRLVAEPVRQGEQIYVVEENGMLRARRRQDGSLLWNFRAPGPLAAAVGADEQRVFLGTSAHALFGLRAGKGTQRWRRKLGADVQTQPVPAGKLLLVASHENVLYALSASNGHLTWRAPLPSRPLAAPLVFSEAVLLACRETDLVGFDLKTGAKLGALRTGAEMRVAPVLAGQQILIGLRAPWALSALGINQEPRGVKLAPPKAPAGHRPAPAASPSPAPTPTPSTAPPPLP